MEKAPRGVLDGERGGGDGMGRTDGVAECDPEGYEDHPGSEVHAAE